MDKEHNEFVLLLGALTGLSLVGVLSVLAVMILRPNADNTQLIVTIIGFLTPTIVSVIGAFKGIQNSHTLKDLTVKVNGNVERQVQQAATVATLTERAANVEVAKQVAIDTAASVAVNTANAIAAANINTPVLPQPLKVDIVDHITKE